MSKLSRRNRLSLAKKGEARRLKPPEDLVVGGVPKPLLTNKLPRCREVALAVEHFRFMEQVSQKEAGKKVTDYIVEVYREASIATIHPIKIRQKVGSMILFIAWTKIQHM